MFRPSDARCATLWSLVALSVACVETVAADDGTAIVAAWIEAILLWGVLPGLVTGTIGGSLGVKYGYLKSAALLMSFILLSFLWWQWREWQRFPGMTGRHVASQFVEAVPQFMIPALVVHLMAFCVAASLRRLVRGPAAQQGV